MAGNGVNQADPAQRTGEKTAMLCKGDELYGIGTIVKLYAMGAKDMLFVCMGEGALYDWLRERGNRVEIVKGLAHFGSGKSSLVTIARTPNAFLQTRSDAARLDSALRGQGITTIHSHWMAQYLIGGWMRRLGYRSVWQINSNMDKSRLGGLAVGLTYRMARWGADLLLPCSDRIADNWTGCGVPMETIRNAAEPMYDQPNELAETPIRCLVAGRLVPDKGHHLALEAVLTARREGLDVRLDIFGGPLEGHPYADQLRATINQADAAEYVRLMGFCQDLRQRHQQYHLGFQARIASEPCSLWVCETMVDGLPLLASATGGTPELVEDGVTGLLYRSDDVEDMTTKLLSLVRDPQRLKSMRKAAFERGRTQFRIDRFVGQTLDAYARLEQASGNRR